MIFCYTYLEYLHILNYFSSCVIYYNKFLFIFKKKFKVCVIWLVRTGSPLMDMQTVTFSTGPRSARTILQGFKNYTTLPFKNDNQKFTIPYNALFYEFRENYKNFQIVFLLETTVPYIICLHCQNISPDFYNFLPYL